MMGARYRRILFFFGPVILSLFLLDVALPRLGLAGWARRTRPARLRRTAVRFRALAVRMGGVLIKVGQFLSARLDVLPEEITSELAGLQDDVPPEPYEAIRRLAEAELGAPLPERYEWFETAPLAAASLGQAHRARLRPDAGGLREVVVKVQRPNIESIIATDLAALGTVARWIKDYPPIRRRADIPALLAEFSRSLREEIDYLAEGRNAETFAANFRQRPQVRVPQIVWTHTTRRVLTLEDVQAIKITDYAAITAAGVDRAEVARRLFDTYLSQIFDDGFFHADPHPGNLFVQPWPQSSATTHPPAAPGEEDEIRGERMTSSPAHPEFRELPATERGQSPPSPPEAERVAHGRREWRLVFVDFGMVGRVPSNLRAGLREAVIGVGTQDAGRVVKAYQLLGVLLPGADLGLIEKAETRMFERFWGKSMQELRQIAPAEMGRFLEEFRELLYSLPFQVPENLILLGRTVAILSGMCTGLHPQFNAWESLAPVAQKLIAEEVAGGWDFWLDEAGKWVRSALAVPPRLEAVLGRLERGGLEVQTPDLSRRLGRLEAAARQLLGGIVFAAFFLGGVQLALAGQSGWATAALAGAALSLLLAWFSGGRGAP